MIGTSKILIRLSVASVVCGAALLWSGQLPLDLQSSLVSSAEARIGRPLTPTCRVLRRNLPKIHLQKAFCCSRLGKCGMRAKFFR